MNLTIVGMVCHIDNWFEERAAPLHGVLPRDGDVSTASGRIYFFTPIFL
jgi:hypothetical protein